MATLPDPRVFAARLECAALTNLLDAASGSNDSRSASHTGPLHDALRRALIDRDEQSIKRMFSAAQSAAQFQLVNETLARLLDLGLSDDGAMVARGFALPLVLVTHARAASELPGSLASVDALRALFEAQQVLGGARNFGLSNALCSLEGVERLSPVAVFHALRSFDIRSLDEAISPAPIAILPNRDEVHLRFLIGASITAEHAPSFTEQAAHVGRWARQCAKAIAGELARPGIELLVLPRSPRDLIRAAHAGRSAQLEAAFNLFVGNAVRKFRLQAGDPCVIVSAHDDADIRVSLSTPFSAALTDGFRWPLHPLDDFALVKRIVSTLLADVRVTDVRELPIVLPANRDNGVPFYPRCDECERLSHPEHRH
jgi:hypothetical protein